MPRTKLRRYFRHGLLPQLIVFEAVARLGSVTRAAEELCLAQPTVSMQIKKLAAAFEVVLFEQRGRRLHLTASGQSLRESCVEMLCLLARAEERLAGVRVAQPEAPRLAAGEGEIYLFESYNSQPVVEEAAWSSRANTTRRST